MPSLRPVPESTPSIYSSAIRGCSNFHNGHASGVGKLEEERRTRKKTSVRTFAHDRVPQPVRNACGTDVQFCVQEPGGERTERGPCF